MGAAETPALNKCTPPSHWDISQTQVSLTGAVPVWGSLPSGWSTSEYTHCRQAELEKRQRWHQSNTVSFLKFTTQSSSSRQKGMGAKERGHQYILSPWGQVDEQHICPL